MATLVLAGGIGDISKIVISLWFRIPAVTIPAALASSGGDSNNYLVLDQTIPLITFGGQNGGTVYDWTFPLINRDGTWGHLDYRLGYVTGNHSAVGPPTYIGVRCNGGSDMTLEVNIQTADAPICTATQQELTDVTVVANPFPFGGTYTATYVRDDISYTDAGGKEYFGNSFYGNSGDGGDGRYAGTPNIVGADKWHHILISWDVTNGCKTHGSGEIPSPVGSGQPWPDSGTIVDFTDRYSKMWCAIDKVNKRGYNLPANWIGWDTGDFELADPNGMLSNTCSQTSRIVGFPELYKVHTEDTSVAFGANNTYYDFGNPTAELVVTSVPSAPVIIPSQVSMEGKPTVPNLLVDMANLQVFVGQTVDTADPAVIALFVTDDGKPRDVSVARGVLGAPAIEFSKRTDWMSGINRGTAGNFDQVGTINPFDPDPTIGA